MILAVTGITGHTGRLFLKELENHRFDGTVRCLVRESSNTELLDKSSLLIEKVIGDNKDEHTLLKLTADADVVMHIYGIRQSIGVLNAAISNNVPRVVMVHTTGVYSKYKMASGEYKEIEATIDQILSSTNIDLTILRPTMIFGDMCDHNISQFIRMVDKYPIMPEIDKGRGRIRPVNARDLAKAYYTVCMKDHLPEVRYDLSGEKSITLHDLFDEIGGGGIGKTVHHISCPMWLGAFGARCVKTLSFGRVDLVEKVLRMGEDRDYGHDAATHDFDYDPEPFDIGLKREIDEYLRSK